MCLLAATLCACADKPQTEIRIGIVPGETGDCSVESKTLPCSRVLDYLKRERRVDRSAQLYVEAGDAPELTGRSVALRSALQGAGYERVGAIKVGFITEPCTSFERRKETSHYVDCLFYSGTRSFRAKDYRSALAQWRRLDELQELSADLEHHRTDAWNNLGYLYFQGWGVAKDRAVALDYWKRAYDRGHEEAAYHLCHFYGNRDEPSYNPSAARGYCVEGLRRYEQLKADDEAKEVVTQLRQYVAELGE